MAAMAAIRCSPATAACAAVGGAMPSRSSGPSHEIASAAAAAMSGSLARKLKPGLQLKYSRGGSIASFNVGGQNNRTAFGLDVHAKAKLSGVEPEEVQEFEADQEVAGDSGGFYEKALLAAAVALVPLVDVEGAFAVQGELGILEGKSVALVHPIVMGGLLVFSLWAGYLGYQWRRVRTLQTEINDLKKQVKPVAVAAGGEKSGPPPPPSPVEKQISALSEERKELVKGGYRDRHFNAGSILLGLGVTSSIGGALNTWFRQGKLFPGPHLFAGAGITICWALAAALVPAMQKGSDTARNLHIGLNVINIGLFIWQIPTGWAIVEKVLEFAPWP